MKLPQKIWIDGKFKDSRKPAVSVFDRGFLYGDGVYETMRVYGRKIFHFPEHYQRLMRSARGLGIKVKYACASLHSAAEKLLQVNGLKEAVVRITLTRGQGPLGFDPRPCQNPVMVMAAVPVPNHAQILYQKGIQLALARVRRNPRVSIDPAFKSINNLNNIFAKMEAIKQKSYEALMLNTEGYLAEGTISNLFFVKGNILHTPSLDCGLLAGVTRGLVIQLAKKRGLKIKEGFFVPKDLFLAHEVFITSTTLEVMPVARIVDEKARVHKINKGRVGCWAKTLRQDYQEEIVK